MKLVVPFSLLMVWGALAGSVSGQAAPGQATVGIPFEAARFAFD